VTNQQLFILPEIPKFHPKSKDYDDFWTEQFDYCINGISIGGKWMPGELYSYINFGTIELMDSATNRKKRGRPLLRDIEWEFFTNYHRCKMEKRGLLWIAGRRGGKSFSGAWLPAYELTFFADNEIVVSAYESRYSDPQMRKVSMHLEGLVDTPFYHNKIKNEITTEIRSGRKVKRNGVWQIEGYNSRIYNIKFKDDHTAANGKAASVFIFEEIGMFENLDMAYNSSEPCWKEGSDWYGVPVLFGTGGDMEKGSVAAQKMFFEPETYNLLAFQDDYTHTTTSICMFTPGWKVLNECKHIIPKDQGGDGETLVTDEAAGRAKIEAEREQKKKGKSRDAYFQHLQYYPDTPDHAFLQSGSNKFPTALLEEQRASVFKNVYMEFAGKKGKMEQTSTGETFVVNRLCQEAPYPFNTQKKEGCVVVYEDPERDDSGAVPWGLYLASTDPYRHDDADNTDSYGSTIIYKRFFSFGKTFDLIVAEYTGRPDTSEDYNEQVRLLCRYYNARNLHENEVTGLKIHFQFKGDYHMLVDQPTDIIRSIMPNSTVQRTKGVHMTPAMRAQAEVWLNDWLRFDRGGGDLNLHHIYSTEILNELINYNRRGNFDRVDALLIMMILLKSMEQITVETSDSAEVSSIFDELNELSGWKTQTGAFPANAEFSVADAVFGADMKW
jgi:hypothetical protein